MVSDLDFFVQGIEDGRESWKFDHDGAMECRNIEDTVCRGIGFFYVIRFSDESWSKKVQKQSEPFDITRAKMIREQYSLWLKPCPHVLSLVEEAERQFKVEGAETFRDCIMIATKLANIDVDSLAESVAQATDGNSELLTDGVWDGLYGKAL